MEGQRERARAASKFASGDVSIPALLAQGKATKFLGYEGTSGSSKIVALVRRRQARRWARRRATTGAMVLESTPFYAESGGQVGDTGVIRAGDHSFTVTDTQKGGNAIVHYGSVQAGEFRVGDTVEAEVDAERRQATVLNHSATHLMHAALRQVLGEHVQQKGSLVAPDRLRFDFSHYEPVTAEQLERIEDLVNAEIRKNVAADIKHMRYDDAVASGAIALFGEKYGDEVRVLRFGDFSVELCGGTHVARTGDIGLFKITSEGGVAAGIRRIEAVTGKGALETIDANERILDEVVSQLRGQRSEAPAKVRQLLKRNKELEKELAAAKQALVTGSAVDRTADVTDVGGHQGARDAHRRRRREDAARRGGPLQGQAEERGRRGRLGGRRHGAPRRRRHQGQYGPDPRGRPDQARGRAGRRQGGRQAGFRAGRRQQTGRAGRRARLRAGLGRGTTRPLDQSNPRQADGLCACGAASRAKID